MFLGIDIGTSSVKTILVDEYGAVIDHSSAPLAVARPHPGWSEQNPADWWETTNRAVNLLASPQRRRVRAIGLSGQMHGATLLDASDRALRPAILWNDGRSARECTVLEAVEPRSRRITGNAVMPGFTAPKLLWVREHEPDLFAATRTVLLPKDYVRLCMTGEKATDLSDASGTLWLEVGKRAWSSDMLSATGLSEAHMPHLYEGLDITGRLRPDVATAWGIERVAVAAGGGDNAAGAVGVGVVNEGDTLSFLRHLWRHIPRRQMFRPNPERAVHAFCHALPDRWHQMTVMLSAASCLDWAARLTGAVDVASLLTKIETRAKLDGNEIFLPYLSGERTPHNDPQARGVLFGLSHDSDAAAIGQAVLEGVAFALADGLDALTEAGALVGEISVIGGGARSQWWAQVISAALNRSLQYHDNSDLGPAYGAARLARLAVTQEALEDICIPQPLRAVVEPNSRDVDMLAGKRERFKALYKNLRSQFYQ